MEIKEMVRMANQIADFFKGYGHDEAVKEVADHINRFWDPRMRSAFFRHLESGGAGFTDLVKDAAPLVRKPGSATLPMREPKDRKTGLPKEAHEA